MTDQNEIVLYQPNELTKLEVRVENETVWLSQQQMAMLFQTTPQNITMHIRNLYKEGEQLQQATCKDFLQVRQEGDRIVSRNQKFYTLDIIISVGYRVKSLAGVRFRQWATSVLKDYTLRGYAISQRLQRIEGELAMLCQLSFYSLQSLIDSIATKCIFSQHACCPLTKTNTCHGFNTVSDRYNNI